MIPRMIPREIMKQGAPVVYGWLLYWAQRAVYRALTEPRVYGPRPGGSWGEVNTPRARQFEALARRLHGKLDRVGRLLTLHGGLYVPWRGYRGTA